jgi:hypothetical protein
MTAVIRHRSLRERSCCRSHAGRRHRADAGLGRPPALAVVASQWLYAPLLGVHETGSTSS